MTDGDSLAPTIAVVVTAHNRRDATLACLAALHLQTGAPSTLSVFLTDDGSTDGTEEAVLARYPGTRLAHGTGELYWAAGMALSERAAMRANPDFLLWLNDDVVLDPNAVDHLLRQSAARPKAIIVGAMRDPISGADTYGGRVRAGRHPMRQFPVPSSDQAQAVDSFNGNCVLIPRSVRQVVGPIDGLYAHAYADDDYAYRASKLGIALIQCPGTVGTCPRHTTAGVRREFGEAWRFTTSPKGAPWRSQSRFLKRHAGPEWPLLVAWTEARFLLRAVKGDV